MFDLVIRGGTVVDGLGGAPFKADVGVKDGKIAAIGEIPAGSGPEIDAAGALVTPGFVDLHGHYDGQVSWDEELAPSSVHGVTTTVFGNCGVGFAPVRPTDHAVLVDLMEGVEDIPGAALAEGIRWNWESFPDYLDALDRQPHAIDFAAHVPHDALRVYVMGQRGVNGEPATAEDIAEMKRLLGEALDAGAIGFSTGRSDVHRSAGGKNTPAAEASFEELRGLGAALAERGRGVLQAVSDFDMETSKDRFEIEFDVLQALAQSSGGRPMSVSCSQRDMDPTQWVRIIERVEKANEQGLPMRVQVAPRGIGVILGLQLTFHPLIGLPTYKSMAHLPLAERVARLRQPEVMAQLLSEKSETLAGDGSAVPPLVDKLLQLVDRLAFRMYRLGDKPNYEPTVAESLGAEAMARKVPAMRVLVEAMLEDEGRGLIYFPIYNYLEGNLDTVGRMMAHPYALPGLSDGGAHVGTICDASFPTFLLAHWCRDRAKDRIPVEKAVRFLTSLPTAYLGLKDRGALEVGKKADINVIDLDALQLERPRLVKDLPAGGQRMLQGVKGIRATLVAGQVIAREGQLTGARPGRLVRGA